MSILVSDSVGKVLKFFRFFAVFHDSATDCTKLRLSEDEREKLEHWLKNPPQPYLRYRARAILQIVQGMTILEVAQNLKIRVHRVTVSEWIHRFEEKRVEGLKIQPGRGRKPDFSPSTECRGEAGN